MKRIWVWMVLVFGLCLAACGDEDEPVTDMGQDLQDVVSDAMEVTPDLPGDLPDAQEEPEVAPDVVEDEVEEIDPGTPVGDCEPTLVRRFNENGGTFISVKPHDWSADTDENYTWYDGDELYEWILTGTQTSVDYAAALTEVEYPVVGTDGLPNIVPNPAWIPYWFSRTYYSPTLDAVTNRATSIYGWADESDTLEPDDIADELVDQDNNPLTTEDREVYEMLMFRYNRWNTAMDGLREVVDDHFGFDSENLQCAMDNVDEGESVRFVHEEGEVYVLNQAVVVEDFTGELAGQGAGETVIKTAAGGFISPPGPQFDVRTTVLLFVGGDFVLRDFDFVTEGTAQWGSHYVLQDSFFAIYITGPHDGEADDVTTEVSAEVRSIRFFGESGEQYQLGTNMIASVVVVGEQLIERDLFNGNLFTGKVDPLKANVVLDGCSSINSLNGLAGLWGLTNAEARLTNNYGTGTDEIFSISDCNGGNYTISRNETENGGGLSLDEGASALWGIDLGPTGIFPAAPCNITIEDNTFRSTESWWAPLELHSYMYLADPPLPSSRLKIKGNTIESVNNFPGGDFAYEGIFADGLDNGYIANNTFVGTGAAAVNIGLFETEDTHWLIQNNHFAGYNAGVADIHLGPETVNNRVIGATSETTTLLDESSGNTHSNVTLVE